MKQTILLFLTTFVLLMSQPGCSQKIKTAIVVHHPTINQEATSIWRTINDIKFFRNQGYKINLPDHSVIDSLLIKAENGKFGPDDFAEIYSLLESEIYDTGNYMKAARKTIKETQRINRLVHRLKTTKNEWDWEFKMFDSYTITFTLYGTGGSYNADEGSILLLATTVGTFMNYDSPVNSIVHEIVHIGVEESLVQKHSLGHETKENLVDNFVVLMFDDLVPAYQKQPMGTNEIGQFFNKKSDLKTLSSDIATLNGNSE